MFFNFSDIKSKKKWPLTIAILQYFYRSKLKMQKRIFKFTFYNYLMDNNNNNNKKSNQRVYNKFTFYNFENKYPD